jgi:hypothetical protein
MRTATGNREGTDMRQIAAAVVAALFFVVAGPSLGAQHLRGYAGGGIGLVSPAGSYGDVDQKGWQLSLAGLGTLKGSLSLLAHASYGRTAHQNDVAGKTALMGGGADFALFLAHDRRVRPFLAVGAGLYRVDVEVPGFGGAVATKPAFDVGGGVLVASGARRVLIALRYVSVHTTPQRTSFLPLSVGLLLPVGRH